MKVKLSDIHPMYDLNARTDRSYNDEHFRALKQSIGENGLIEPLVVYPYNNKYVLIAGYRRYTAITQLIKEGKISWDEVDVVQDSSVSSADDIGRAVLYRQLQNKSFTISEKAKAFSHLSKDLKVKDIAKELGENQSFIETLVFCSELLASNATLAQMVDEKEISLANLKYAARMWLQYTDLREEIEEATCSFGSMPHSSYALMLEKVLPKQEEITRTFDEYVLDLRTKKFSPTMKNRLDVLNQLDKKDKYSYLRGKLRTEEEILQILAVDEDSCPDEVSYVIQMLFRDIK